jgi:hypothetical protein
MATISRWVVPCYFTDEKHKTDLIAFDLTKHLKQMLQNEVWNRKFNYGFNTGLKNTDSTDIEKATIKVFPRFISGYVNETRLPELIEEQCGKLPTHLKLKSHKEWSHHLGLVIIETEYKTAAKDIPSKKDLTEDIMPHFERGFIEKYHRHLAVLKELASFFLAGIHLSFPTESVMMRNDNPVNDGFFQISSGRQTYACKVATNAFMHEILIEKSKLSNIETNLNGLASVWHYDLWSLNRYLKAVESDQISIDNLLDLIYSLEGLFDKSTSSEFVKTMCLLNLCRTKKEARSMKNLLDLAYRIRNDIAHGGLSYDPYDYVKLEGKDILAQTVYWKIKSITAAMLIKAISKLINNKEMRNLRFNVDDLINLTFQK